MKHLGIAMGAYEQANQRFPPSSLVSRSKDGTITAVDGWSWLVALLPYWQEKSENHGNISIARKLYDSLDVAHRLPLEQNSAKTMPHADELNVSLPEFVCPSFEGTSSASPTTETAAITNYRSMGATHVESLSVASPHPLTPKYGLTSLAGRFSARAASPLHPDGACFPGDGLKPEDFDKGTAYTVFCVESLESRFARWTVGSEAAIVGLPPNVDFEKDLYEGCTPRGYRKAFDKDSPPNSVYWTYHTYLDWDYNQNPYDSAGGIQRGRYGPSSNHPGVVNHLFASGHAGSIQKSIDVTVYMFLITHHQVTPFGSNDDGR